MRLAYEDNAPGSFECSHNKMPVHRLVWIQCLTRSMVRCASAAKNTAGEPHFCGTISRFQCAEVTFVSDLGGRVQIDVRFDDTRVFRLFQAGRGKRQKRGIAMNGASERVMYTVGLPKGAQTRDSSSRSAYRQVSGAVLSMPNLLLRQRTTS